jgi:hypothetical protein
MSRDGRDEENVEEKDADADAMVDVVDAEGERLVRVVVLAVVVELAAVLDESNDEEVVVVAVVDVEDGGVMICHWGSGRDGFREAGSGRRRTTGKSGSASSSEEDGDESLTGESRMRLDSLGWKWKWVVCACACCCWFCCALCCSRSFSTCAARLRSSMVLGETTVTALFSFFDRSDEF